MTVEPKYVETDFEGEELTDEELEALDKNRVRPNNFTKTNWKTASARDEWKDIHQRIRQGTQEAEWRSILSNRTDRKAAIIHVNNWNREDWLRRVGEYGLHYRDIRFTKSYEGFAHEFHETTKDDAHRLTYAVIAENPDIADKMEEAELEMEGFERHDLVGKLLGFPKCCRKWFWENWGMEEGKNVDPMYEAAANSDSATAIDGDRENILIEEPNPYLNPLYRYWGLNFVTHMPCSFDCEESAEIGKARGEIMAEHGYRDEANRLYQWLKLPMVWESRLGIAQVKNPYWIGSANSAGYWNKKRIVWGEEYDSRDVVE